MILIWISQNHTTDNNRWHSTSVLLTTKHLYRHLSAHAWLFPNNRPLLAIPFCRLYNFNFCVIVYTHITTIEYISKIWLPTHTFRVLYGRSCGFGWILSTQTLFASRRPQLIRYSTNITHILFNLKHTTNTHTQIGCHNKRENVPERLHTLNARSTPSEKNTHDLAPRSSSLCELPPRSVQCLTVWPINIRDRTRTNTVRRPTLRPPRFTRLRRVASTITLPCPLPFPRPSSRPIHRPSKIRSHQLRRSSHSLLSPLPQPPQQLPSAI